MKLATRIAYGAVFGDILMKCLYRMRPYEAVKVLLTTFIKMGKTLHYFPLRKTCNFSRFNQLCRQMIREFDTLPITNEKKPRVGIVGEILVKFHPGANNHLVELLEKEGAEAVCPDLIDFMCYCFYNMSFKSQYLGFQKSFAQKGKLAIKAIDFIRKAANDEFKKSRHFTPSAQIESLAKMAEPIVSIGNQTGEGWFLTGEMLELIHADTPNIVCIQPFGCLPNHIVGKV